MDRHYLRSSDVMTIRRIRIGLHQMLDELEEMQDRAMLELGTDYNSHSGGELEMDDDGQMVMVSDRYGDLDFMRVGLAQVYNYTLDILAGKWVVDND